ncbi:hypothetical protein XENOCAPTIV_018387 [Xenoophorus captivus]|uniref:Uncharacterized protein n=1 Tax=Xenoophorus captivus TaxID=1517983 RepID=A0ABV0RB27_9TELE
MADRTRRHDHERSRLIGPAGAATAGTSLTCAVLPSQSLLLESCLSEITFIHDWVSMTTWPRDDLSLRPPWYDGQEKPRGEYICTLVYPG